MRTLRTIGIAASAVALLSSATFVFAKDDATSTPAGNGFDDRGGMMSPSTVRMQSLRDAAQARMENERAKAGDRLKEIQDKSKQDMAQSLAVRFNSLNTKWTDNFSQILDRYDAIVQKIQDRSDIAAAAQKDVSATTAAIASARTAILNARNAVAAQAVKTFDLTLANLPAKVTSKSADQEKMMESLRSSFKNLNSGLFQDLFALRDGPMKDARSAVKTALDTLSAVPGVDDDNGSGTSGNK